MFTNLYRFSFEGGMVGGGTGLGGSSEYHCLLRRYRSRDLVGVEHATADATRSGLYHDLCTPINLQCYTFLSCLTGPRAILAAIAL